MKLLSSTLIFVEILKFQGLFLRCIFLSCPIKDCIMVNINMCVFTVTNKPSPVPSLTTCG